MEDDDLTVIADSHEKFVTVGIVAEFLSVPVNTCYKMCLNGSLPSYKFGKLRRLKMSEVVTHLNQFKVSACSFVEESLLPGAEEKKIEKMYFRQLGMALDEIVNSHIKLCGEAGGVDPDIFGFCLAVIENFNLNLALYDRENVVVERKTEGEDWDADIIETMSISQYFRLGMRL
jgi:excisionase family DNA binding protein